MKVFFEELAKIEAEHIHFFEENHIQITQYIQSLKNPAMVSFVNSMQRNYPLPDEIKNKIDTLIANPRFLCNERTKVLKVKPS